MERLPESTVYERALELANLGYTVIPIMPGQKAPSTIKWKPYQSSQPTGEELWQWFDGTTNNLAIVTGDVIVVDVDDENLLDLVLEKAGRTEMISRTPRLGYHAFYRARRSVHVGNKVDVKGKELDLRGTGGYAVVAPSRTADGSYEWLGQGPIEKEALPVFKVKWSRTYRRKKVIEPATLSDIPDAVPPSTEVDFLIRRARGYLATVPGAVSHQHGHDKTLRAAAVLCQKFRLTPEQALPLLEAWNATCKPPWEIEDLIRKLNEAYRLRFDPRAMKPVV